MVSRRFITITATLVAIATVSGNQYGSQPALAAKKSAESKKETADESMKLKAGEEGTIFKSLRIEGEDRVRIEYERPTLRFDVDPRTAPGLDWENLQTVLDRSSVELVPPFLNLSAVTAEPQFARPWLGNFATGNVAWFRPRLEDVDRWRLTVANSKGETVMAFDGKGNPPEEITWDGRSLAGSPVPPGYVYSYVLEAYDRAGNKRNFVGEGFEIPSYRIATDTGMAFLCAGSELVHDRPVVDGVEPAPAILLEAASWINQLESTDTEIRIEVTAPTRDDAARVAKEITRHMAGLVLGDPDRIQHVTTVEAGAPDRGTVTIVVSSQS